MTGHEASEETASTGGFETSGTNTTFLGLDVGATTVRAVIGSGDGTILANIARPTPDGSPEAFASEVRVLLQDVCAAAAVEPSSVVAAGIGSMGPLGRPAGVAVDPPNLALDRVPLVDPVEDVLDADLHLYNDATAAAIGERFVREPDVANLVYLTVSTGIGAGAIVDGKPVVGATGNAVEAGHFVLDRRGPALCGCGGTGHWEGYASGANLPDYARHLAHADGLETALDLEALDARTIYEATDPLAETVRERAVGWHAQGVSILVRAFDPDLVAIGGSVAVENRSAVVSAVCDRLPALLGDSPPRVELTALGDAGGAMGALACAITGGTGERHR
ncbi:MAG: ROK family protein [Haloarculaceae archaeon]